MILSIYPDRNPDSHPILHIESDGNGKYKIEGHNLPRQNGGNEYETEDGLHVLGLICLIFGANDSAEYLRRMLDKHYA